MSGSHAIKQGNLQMLILDGSLVFYYEAESYIDGTKELKTNA
jgi:hypothetical protein